jgi:hypothetical protein
MTRHIWREWTFFLYWSAVQFIAALSLQIASKVKHLLYLFINKINCKNIFWSQILDKFTDTKLTAWLKTPPTNADSAMSHDRHYVVFISYYQRHYRQNLISICAHCADGTFVQSGVTGIDCYIRSSLWTKYLPWLWSRSNRWFHGVVWTEMKGIKRCFGN